MFGFLRKRKKNNINIFYCHKSEVIYAWQFKRENFKEGIPKFVLKNRKIDLWNRDTFGGQIKCGPHEAPNTSDKEQIISIPEGAWIVQYRNGTVDILSDELFKLLYCKVIPNKEDLK